VNGEKGRPPAYRIVTPRLVIRCWDPADAPRLVAAIAGSLDHLRPWLPWALKEPVPVEERIDWLRACRGEFDLGRDFVYGIFDPGETLVLGGTGLHTRPGPGAREIGYWIRSDHTHKGYATEAAAALTKTAILVDGVDRVEIHCDPGNAASAAVPRRLGFTLEGTLRRRTRGSDGNMSDSMVWTLLASELPSSPCARAELTAHDCLGRRIL
jgi:RimJ/RimL family protein N-acetyltransferase